MGEAAELRVRSFSEDEASVECITGWNLHCLQMSAGVLAGEAVDLNLPGFQLLFETYRNVSTSHCGTAPEGAVVFGIARSMSGDGRLNGQPWRDGVSVFDSREALFSLVPPVELITAVVDRAMLITYAREVEHVDLEPWLLHGPLVLDDVELASRVSTCLLQVKAAAQRGWLRAEAVVTQQRLADEALEVLCPLLVRRLHAPPPARRERPQVDLVRRARGWVHERADEPLRISELCRELGVSRRWLQASFNEVMGVGPQAYLHQMRLSGARRLLLQARPGTKVNDAVESYGFWHLSRFSRDYRRQFGELPSHTLRRALTRS
jgi:AraC family transcriptional regulator, ethanolamine operon transcriptional activator